MCVLNIVRHFLFGFDRRPCSLSSPNMYPQTTAATSFASLYILSFDVRCFGHSSIVSHIIRWYDYHWNLKIILNTFKKNNIFIHYNLNRHIHDVQSSFQRWQIYITCQRWYQFQRYVIINMEWWDSQLFVFILGTECWIFVVIDHVKYTAWHRSRNFAGFCCFPSLSKRRSNNMYKKAIIC